MKYILEYESNTFGLWPRFITKLIAGLLFTFIVSIYILTNLNFISNAVVFLVFIIIPLLIVSWIIFKENPLKWRNKVLIDFRVEKIKIQKSKSNQMHSNLLDFEGNQYSFDEIENYSYKHYESFIFSSYYLVKIYVKGKEIKLLSFKSASEFTYFNSVLSNRLKLKIK